MKKIGIYKITNPKNEIYVGQSTDIFNRWISIRSRLGKNQRKLNDSLLKYGLINHKFEIINECEESDLNYFEKYYIKLYDSIKCGLNIQKGGERQFKIFYSEQVKTKISQSLIKNTHALGKKKKYLNGSNPLSKKVGIIKDGIIIKKYESLLHASKDTGYSRSKISKIINKYYKNEKDFINFIYL